MGHYTWTRYIFLKYCTVLLLRVDQFSNLHCCLLSAQECSNYKTIDSADRSADFLTSGTPVCDHDLSGGWYRFVGDAGTRMPTECILNRLVLFGFERRSFSAMSFITPHCTGHHWKHTLNSTICRTLTRSFRDRQLFIYVRLGNVSKRTDRSRVLPVGAKHGKSFAIRARNATQMVARKKLEIQGWMSRDKAEKKNIGPTMRLTCEIFTLLSCWSERP